MTKPKKSPVLTKTVGFKRLPGFTGKIKIKKSGRGH